MLAGEQLSLPLVFHTTMKTVSWTQTSVLVFSWDFTAGPSSELCQICVELNIHFISFLYVDYEATLQILNGVQQDVQCDSYKQSQSTL